MLAVTSVMKTILNLPLQLPVLLIEYYDKWDDENKALFDDFVDRFSDP